MTHIRLGCLMLFSLLLISACGSSGGGIIPAAPTNVRATPDTGAIIVTWQDMSASETGFTIYRETVAAANLTSQAFSEVGEVGANETSYRDESIQLNASYRYAVAANGPGGNSAQTAFDTPVSVANKLPVIVYTLDTSIDTAILNAEVSDIDGAVTSVVVDWGDGQTETVTDNFAAIELEHTYTAFATYQVTITATDDVGGVETKSEDLDITAFPTQGLIAEFLTDERLEESFRIVADSSGQSNNGYLPTSNSSELSSGTDRFGLADRALDFRGTDAGQKSIMEIRTDTEEGAIDYGDTLSLAVWANSGGGDRFLIGPRVGSRGFDSPGLLGSGDFEVPLGNDGAGYTLENPNSTEGPWRFYVVTLERDGADVTITLYVNGVRAAEDTIEDTGATAIPTASSLIVGARATYTNSTAGSDDYTGLLDDIRVYDRVLRASEIKSLYEEGGWTGNP